MATLTVGLGPDSYEIRIGGGLLGQFSALVGGMCTSDTRIALVSDENVWRIYGEAALEALKTTGRPVHPVILPPGEESKSIQRLTGLYQSFAQAPISREDLVIAFGGGVIGDVTGFAAATWMRGVRYVQVPTTLLAQVDSSVGGKTAVNLAEGKNLVGSFYQPSAVFADTDVLSTLPPRELACGMAEVIKYGAIRSEELFDKLCNPPEKADLEHIIHDCCAIKADIVSRDEKDRGERMLLNFGHTFGHAVEQMGGYSKWNHGEGVAIGMVVAAKVGERMDITPHGTADRLAETLRANHLPVACPCPPADLLPAMQLDKKSGGGAVKLILLKKLGEAIIQPVSYQALAALLEGMGE